MAEQSDDEYEVKVKGRGIAADKNVSLPKALAVLQIMFAEEFSPASHLGHELASSPNSAPSAVAAVPGQRVSIKEFLAQVGGRHIHAKIAVIGRYMRDHEGLNDFSRDDIKARFRSAGELMPGNYPRDFHKALQAGWIGEDPQSRGRFYITRTGDEAINNRFESAAPPVVRNRRRRRLRVDDGERQT